MEQERKLLEPFRVVCIDSDAKPDTVEDSEWIEEGTEEIVVDVFKHLITGEMSYKLLDKNPDPYRGYRANRFIVMNKVSVN